MPLTLAKYPNSLNTPNSREIPPSLTKYPELLRYTPNPRKIPQLSRNTPNSHEIPQTLTKYPQLSRNTPNSRKKNNSNTPILHDLSRLPRLLCVPWDPISCSLPHPFPSLPLPLLAQSTHPAIASFQICSQGQAWKPLHDWVCVRACVCHSAR